MTAPKLYQPVKNLNMSILNEFFHEESRIIENEDLYTIVPLFFSPFHGPLASQETALYWEISKLSLYLGFSDPTKKIYETFKSKHIENFPYLLFVITNTIVRIPPLAV